MMTRGRGVFWPVMTSSQEPQFFGKFLGFIKEFSKIFLKIFCAESLAVHTAVACVWLVARYS